jgi:hypothetical protein
VYDQLPLFSFVTIDGFADTINTKPRELFKWARIIVG